MLDYCMDCSIEKFGDDLGIFMLPFVDEDMNVSYYAICAVCGPMYVDSKGECIQKLDNERHDKSSE